MIRLSLLLLAVALTPLVTPPCFADPKVGGVQQQRAKITFDEFLAGTALWTTPREQTASILAGLHFDWTSSEKDTLRSEKGGKHLGIDVGESLVRFDTKTGYPSQIELSIFNRGDRGDISEKEFNTLIERTMKALDEAAGTTSKSIKRDNSSAVRAEAAVWAAKTLTYKLEWSKNRQDGKRPEFLRLQIFPAGKAAGILKAAETTSADPGATYKGSDHLESTPAGDKWLKDVPMVDQGKKGYCAVASTERVLRLYGMEVDQHELAQLAGSESGGGTDPGKLIRSFKANIARLKVRMKVLLEPDLVFFQSLASDYNGAARKAKKPLLPDPRTKEREFFSNFTFDSIDGETLLAGRKHNASGIRKFEKIVADSIDKGRPVLWGVTLGIAPEKPLLPQTRGGHLRLIIGYNAKEDTVIYTDSWGAGHERKVMPAATAFAITNLMMELIP